MTDIEKLKHKCVSNNIHIFNNATTIDMNNMLNMINNLKQSNFIDLFSGIGGFHQVLSKLGFICNLACDNDKWCREVYEKNYNLKPVENVLTIDEKQMPYFDILCAGFPCQSFSNAGKKKSFTDKRGLLFDEIIRIANEKKPRFMFLENVKHILKVSNGDVIEYIKQQIANIGYTLQLFNMSPHEYGIPQQRERVYFVCVRDDIYNDIPIKLVYDKVPNIIRENFLDKKEDIDNIIYLDAEKYDKVPITQLDLF